MECYQTSLGAILIFFDFYFLFCCCSLGIIASMIAFGMIILVVFNRERKSEEEPLLGGK